MIITRTPLELPLVEVVRSSTITRNMVDLYSAYSNKYMYISTKRSFADDLIRVKYSKSETVKRLNQLDRDC